MITSVIYEIVAVMAGWMMMLLVICLGGWYVWLATDDKDNPREYSNRVMLWLAGWCTLFQIGHLAEHSIQLVVWFKDPTAVPYMSPVADITINGLAQIARHSGNMAVGMEVLHLLGNSVFFIGLLAWRVRFSNRWLTMAYRLQAFHVVEHITLTATILVFGRPLGVSTLFGLIGELGWVGSAYRIWWHFGMNLIATGLCVAAVYPALREFVTTRVAYRAITPERSWSR